MRGAPHGTNTHTQIQMHKYKCTNTNAQIQIRKYKCTNTNTLIMTVICWQEAEEGFWGGFPLGKAAPRWRLESSSITTCPHHYLPSPAATKHKRDPDCVIFRLVKDKTFSGFKLMDVKPNSNILLYLCICTTHQSLWFKSFLLLPLLATGYLCTCKYSTLCLI